MRRSAVCGPVRVGRLLGRVGMFALCLVLAGATGRCDRQPTCDGSCPSPADLDDCALCCNTSEREGLDCCASNYPAGSDERMTCENNVARRWSGGQTGGPVGPVDPNTIFVFFR